MQRVERENGLQTVIFIDFFTGLLSYLLIFTENTVRTIPLNDAKYANIIGMAISLINVNIKFCTDNVVKESLIVIKEKNLFFSL